MRSEAGFKGKYEFNKIILGWQLDDLMQPLPEIIMAPELPVRYKAYTEISL